MDTDSVPIDVYISKNYNKIKRLLLYEWHKKSLMEFDEDLFHNTLLNSLKTLSGCNLSEKEITNYIVAAFKSNTLRETLYHRNLMKADVEIDITNLGETIEMDDLDYDRIMLSIEDKFGKELMVAFKMWTEGYTVKEIEGSLDKTQMTYQIKKVRDWVHETYSEFKD